MSQPALVAALVAVVTDDTAATLRAAAAVASLPLHGEPATPARAALDDAITRRLAEIVEEHGGVRAAARALGIPPRTLQWRRARAARRSAQAVAR